jgi:hypothetical protein
MRPISITSLLVNSSATRCKAGSPCVCGHQRGASGTRNVPASVCVSRHCSVIDALLRTSRAVCSCCGWTNRSVWWIRRCRLRSCATNIESESSSFVSSSQTSESVASPCMRSRRSPFSHRTSRYQWLSKASTCGVCGSNVPASRQADATVRGTGAASHPRALNAAGVA